MVVVMPSIRFFPRRMRPTLETHGLRVKNRLEARARWEASLRNPPRLGANLPGIAGAMSRPARPAAAAVTEASREGQDREIRGGGCEEEGVEAVEHAAVA